MWGTSISDRSAATSNPTGRRTIRAVSTASQADVNRMQGVAEVAFAELVPLLPETDWDWHGNLIHPHEKAAPVWLQVQQWPTAEDRALVNVPEPDRLLGLHDPSRDLILIFASDTLAGGMDARRVLYHELGHAIYDYPDIASATTDSSLASAPEMVSRPHREFTDDCPVCQVFERSAVAYGLVLMLDPRALLYHRIPDGWGGTIPLARHRIAQAQALLPIAAPLIPDQWMVAELDSRLAEAQWALSGTLSVEDLGAATHALYRALDGAADVNGSFWASHPHS